jgi:LysM repeat protein
VPNGVPHGDTPANVRTQEVKSGDTLSKVSRELCTRVDDLATLNHLTPDSKLRAGDWLAIPATPEHAPAVTELLTTVANGATDDVAGMLTFELPGYEVTRDSSEPFAWQARNGELRIRVLIRDACVSFTDTRTGSGGSALVQGPSANQGTGPEDLSAAIRRAHQTFNAVQSAAPRP